MRYSLWSCGRLVGHTDLDIHTVTPTMRQGFIDPAPEGKSLLEDATGVWRAMAARKRAARARGGEELPEDDDLVLAAMERRESLDLELRDERGEVFECDFMRIYDLFDSVDEMADTEEEEEAKFEIYLSRLAPEERVEAVARRAESQAEIEEFVAQLEAHWEEEAMFKSSWPPPPPEDPRWDTMQYHLQVHLERSDEYDIGDDLDVPEF